MARQLFIGLITEGPTDVRFLQSVVERTFIDVAFECENDLEPYVKCLTVEKVRLSFNEYVEKASRRGMEEMGMDILCVHTDADSKDTKRAYAEKINPAYDLYPILHPTSLYPFPLLIVLCQQASMLLPSSLEQ